MSQKDYQEPDGESSNPISNASLAAHLSATAPTPPPFNPGAFGSLANTQQNLSSLLDPNVMMMTNAAATIAAVAASAVQQMNQAQQAASNPSSQHSAQSTLAAALKASKPLISHPGHAQAATNPTLAALLGASNPAPQPQNPFSSHGTALNQLLGIGDNLPVASGSAPQPTSTAALSPSATTNALLPNMQSWSLKQLEQHVNLLQQMNQSVPQYLALLLTEARRKRKKKNAKRVANRKSASTSRARKKALVEEMTRTNARLKRQALILALLPDLVVAISTDGEITFCSDQVEKVLQHKIDDLIGAQLSSLLVPASRDALRGLIDELANTDKSPTSDDAQPTQARHGTKRRMSDQRNSSGDTAETAESKATENGNGDSKASGRGSSNTGEDTSAAAIVSEQSFPPSVVEVDSKQSARPAAEINEQNDNSDTSASNCNGKQQMSSLTNSTRSPTVSSGDDHGGARQGSREQSANGKRMPSSDDSSSLSSDAKNMSKANENLDRNVRWHNQRMMEDSQKNVNDDGPKDDVTGASVTANNATARLSSLKHVPDFSKRKDDKAPRYESTGDQSSSDDSLLAGVEEKKKAGENASDDSGYRESNDSREETSSSGSDTSNSNDRQKKPLAPTCRMCLIRQDLTTVWCEVTSSIRTRSADEESADTPSNGSKPNAPPADAAVTTKEEVKELLLCLRPIRDGEKKVDESLRFVSQKILDPEISPDQDQADGMISSSSGDANKQENSSGSGSNNSNQEPKKRPPKKRVLPTAEGAKRKKQKANGSKNASDTEKSVVESLMLMNKSSQ